MNKNGSSYIEALIALAVFCVALMPLLSGLYGAYGNRAYAIDEYDAHLQAQQIMTVVRDAYQTETDPVAALGNAGSIPPRYGVWVDSLLIAGQGELPDVTAAMDGLSGSLITVIVWAEGSEAYGCAYGVAP
jgi:hypothetical protein